MISRLPGVRGHGLLSREGQTDGRQLLPWALLNRGHFESEHQSLADYMLDLIVLPSGVWGRLQTTPNRRLFDAHRQLLTKFLAPASTTAGQQGRKQEEYQSLVACATCRGYTSPGEDIGHRGW